MQPVLRYEQRPELDMRANPIQSNVRRSLLKRAVLLLAGVAAVPLARAPAHAAEKLQKAAVSYQDKPKNGKDCDDCMHFIAGTTANAVGACKVVEGAISPHGYCAAFTPGLKNSK
jgi:hypothetical protein